MTAGHRPTVLFVCVHNAGRSQMASALLTRDTSKRYLDWALDDPAGRDVTAVRVIRDEIARRVESLASELGA